MDKAYKIVPLENQEYAYLIILCNANSPYDYINDILKELDSKSSEKVLIDQMLHVGNNEKRFITFKCDGQNSVSEKQFVRIKKDSPLRRTSCEFFRGNEVIENSILSSVQKRMIKKGIVI